MALDTLYAGSVIIPAHNEALVIGRLLSVLPREVGGKPLQIVVSCNGCTDGTAGIASDFGVDVVEVAAPSKIAALNAGDATAVAFPRLYVDADIEITARAVEDIVRALSLPGALCAAPPSRMELSGRPWLVKAYFTFWRRLMQMREGFVGAGVYALSAEGRDRFVQFPDIVADDTFVRNLFSRSERHTVATDPTVVQAPYTVRALFNRRVRVCTGNLQLASRAVLHPSPGSQESRISWWQVPLQSPALIPHSIVYAAVNGLARVSAAAQARSSEATAWGRDETTRSAQSCDQSESGRR